jgi:hypothetical protein
MPTSAARRVKNKAVGRLLGRGGGRGRVVRAEAVAGAAGNMSVVW